MSVIISAMSEVRSHIDNPPGAESSLGPKPAEVSYLGPEPAPWQERFLTMERADVNTTSDSTTDRHVENLGSASDALKTDTRTKAVRVIKGFANVFLEQPKTSTERQRIPTDTVPPSPFSPKDTAIPTASDEIVTPPKDRPHEPPKASKESKRSSHEVPKSTFAPHEIYPVTPFKEQVQAVSKIIAKGVGQIAAGATKFSANLFEADERIMHNLMTIDSGVLTRKKAIDSARELGGPATSKYFKETGRGPKPQELKVIGGLPGGNDEFNNTSEIKSAKIMERMQQRATRGITVRDFPRIFADLYTSSKIRSEQQKWLKWKTYHSEQILFRAYYQARARGDNDRQTQIWNAVNRVKAEQQFAEEHLLRPMKGRVARLFSGYDV